jgi:RNA polymerase-binding transcription factor DksA
VIFNRRLAMNKPTMTGHELRTFRRRLGVIVTRLGGEVTELRDEALRPLAAEAADRPGGEAVHDADLGGRVAEEELALELLGPEEHVLAEVTAALARIDQGTFGRCEGCGKPIGRSRLDALPYARHCVRCARQAEAAS